MRIRQWISGKELMERWQANPLDLVDAVIHERLPVYEPDGRLAEYKDEDTIRANHPAPFPTLPKKDNPSIYELILNPEAYDYEIPGTGIPIPPEYVPLADRIGQLMFKLIEVERFEKENNLILQDAQPERNDAKRIFHSHEKLVRKEASEFWRINPDITIQDMTLNVIVKKEAEVSSLDNEVKQRKERKKSKLQICKEKVREKAIEIWKKESPTTIAAMGVSDEITNITMGQCGKMFNENTIRGWIKDLCPNPSPGRPPKREK